VTAWASVWDGHDRRALRIGLCVIAGVEWCVEAAQVAWQSQDPAHYLPGLRLAPALAAIPGAAWILYALTGVGLVLLALDRHPVAAGSWALGCAAVLSEWQTQVFGSPSRNAFFPGAAILGWVLGSLWADSARPRPSRAVRERFAEAGALGCIAAAYVGSCASKLLAAGAGWADGLQIRALVVQQQPVASWSWLLAWREAIVSSADLASASAVATLVVEGGAFALLLGPRLRLTWAALLVGLHAAILLLCTMPYLEPVALLVLFAIPWPRLQRRAPSRAIDPPQDAIPWGVVALLAAMVAIAWILAPLGWRG